MTPKLPRILFTIPKSGPEAERLIDYLDWSPIIKQTAIGFDGITVNITDPRGLSGVMGGDQTVRTVAHNIVRLTVWLAFCNEVEGQVFGTYHLQKQSVAPWILEHATIYIITSEADWILRIVVSLPALSGCREEVSRACCRGQWLSSTLWIYWEFHC